MRKKGEKEKDGKKINFEELITKSLSEPRMTLDYAGFQFTVLNLSVPSSIYLGQKPGDSVPLV